MKNSVKDIGLKSALFARVVVLVLVSCTGKSTLSENKPATDSVRTEETGSLPEGQLADALYTGTFEYSTPDDDGYLYYKLDIVQQGDSVKGTLHAGNYLASGEGGYTNPNVLMECSVTGSVEEQDGKSVMLILLNINKYEPLEEGAPSLKSIMNFPDLDVDVDATYWTLTMKDGVLQSNNGQRNEAGEMKLLDWERAK